MNNVSHSGKPKKKDKFMPNQQHSQYMPEPRKMMKMNNEPQPNMLSNIPPHHQEQVSSPPFNDQYDGLDDDDHFRNPGQHGQMNRQKMKKMPFRPTNYKTVPCVWFHSPQGCQYGDSCNFIHDQNHPGRQTPNMHKYVRSIDQLNKKEGEELEGGLNPGFSPSASNDSAPSPFFNPKAEVPIGNIKPGPEVGRPGIEKGLGPAQGGGPGHFVGRPPINHNRPPGNNMHRMNQPHGGNMHQNPNFMPHNAGHGNPGHFNNRMGGGAPYMNPNMHQGHPNQHGHGNRPPYGNQRGGHGHGRGGYHNHGHNQGQGGHGHGPNMHNPSMMIPPEHNNFQNNNMMYPQGGNRMPQNSYPMHMQQPQMGGYNPHMMPPKNVMPPQGYGLMDLNKGKE